MNMTLEPYTFDAELSLARMAVTMAARHPDDIGCTGLVHQIRRLADIYRRADMHDRANKLTSILTWYDAGAPLSNEVVVLSEARRKREPVT